MKITDAISITELSKQLNKSRPTIYKYISDYESGNLDLVPEMVKELFRLIEEEEISRGQISEYCNNRFLDNNKVSVAAKRAIDYIISHQEDIDFVELDIYLKKVSK